MVSPASVHEIAAISDAVPTIAVSGPVLERNSSVAKKIASLLDGTKIHFQDFESGYPVLNALQDYGNSFYVINLASGRFGLDESLQLMRGVRETGVPKLEDYFCIKYLGKGVSMSPEGIRIWNAMTDDERKFLRDEFRHAYLSDFDMPRRIVLGLLSEDVDSMNRILRDEWPEVREDIDPAVFVSRLSALASRASRMLRALEDEDRLRNEIEAIAQSKTSE